MSSPRLSPTQEEVKILSFLTGATSRYKSTEELRRERERRVRDKAGARRGAVIDPLLKKVMSSVFTQTVLDESTAQVRDCSCRGHPCPPTEKLRIGSVGISGGRSLTRPFRHASRFASPGL
jgi:hypothetical protein